MKSVSVLIPVLNEAQNLPALFRGLQPVLKAEKTEIIFIDNGSEDNSLSLLTDFCRQSGARLLVEAQRGFAQPLNRGLAEAKGELLLFLDADAIPSAGWLKAMREALATADLVVGETESKISGKATAYGKVSLALFKGHSRNTATAHGYALPWGPTCNLGAKRAVFDHVDLFSPEAGGAFDIDWCWRALLGGFTIAFAPKAKITHFRRNDRTSLLAQFDRYGRSEAWLQRTYAFLNGEAENEDSLIASVDAFNRLRARGQGLKGKAEQTALAEACIAFASGVRAGYVGFFRPCNLPRKRPSQAVAWKNQTGGVTVFIPGKGVTEFAGKGLQAWEAVRAGATDAELAKLMTKLFKVPPKYALGEAREFRKALAVV